MRPASLPYIKATGDIWEIRQDFNRLGKPVRVYAWGFSRRDALRNFEQAKRQADQPESDPFKALFDFLWGAAGIIDNVTRSLR